MERIRLQVEDRCSLIDGSPVRRQITVSVGVAALTDDVQTLEELIEAADKAMYRAKKARTGAPLTRAPLVSTPACRSAGGRPPPATRLSSPSARGPL
jgi:GGDEF domain-containing protein